MIQKLFAHTIVRYIIGGGTSAAVNLIIFYIANSIFHIYYLTSGVIAFMIAFFSSWAFHKFWTFREHSRENMGAQGALYFFTSLFGLAINSFILYVSVQHIRLPPLAGQIIAGALTACCTFFISKHFVFKKRGRSTEEVLEELL